MFTSLEVFQRRRRSLSGHQRFQSDFYQSVMGLIEKSRKSLRLISLMSLGGQKWGRTYLRCGRLSVKR